MKEREKRNIDMNTNRWEQQTPTERNIKAEEIKIAGLNTGNILKLKLFNCFYKFLAVSAF